MSTKLLARPPGRQTCTTAEFTRRSVMIIIVIISFTNCTIFIRVFTLQMHLHKCLRWDGCTLHVCLLSPCALCRSDVGRTFVCLFFHCSCQLFFLRWCEFDAHTTNSRTLLAKAWLCENKQQKIRASGYCPVDDLANYGQCFDKMQAQQFAMQRTGQTPHTEFLAYIVCISRVHSLICTIGSSS